MGLQKRRLIFRILMVLVVVGALVFGVVNMTRPTEVHEFKDEITLESVDADGEQLAITLGNLNPGESKEYKIKFSENAGIKHGITIGALENGKSDLAPYITFDAIYDEKTVVSTKLDNLYKDFLKINEVQNGGTLTVRFSIDVGLGNEVQGKETNFKLNITEGDGE